MTQKKRRSGPFVARGSCHLACGFLTLTIASFLVGGCSYSPLYNRTEVRSTVKRPLAKHQTPTGHATQKQVVTPLSVEEAIAVATRENRLLADLRARAPMKQAEIELADQWEDPELRLTEFAIDDMLDGEPTLELALRFPIQRPGSLSAKRALSALSYEHLLARIRDTEYKLAVEIRRLYSQLSLIDLDLQEVAREIEARENHVDLVRRRVRAGVSVEIDLSMASLPYAQALDERELIISRRRAIRAQLGKALGLRGPYSPLLTPMSLKPDQTPLSPLHTFIERAIATHPELHRAMLRKEQANARSFLAKQRQWPWPDFAQVSYEVRHPLEPTRFGLALTLKIPVFEWAGDRIAVHDAEQKLRATEEDTLLHTIEHDVRTAYERVERLFDRLMALQKTLLPATLTSARAVEKATSASSMDPLKAVVIEGRRIRAKRHYLRVLAEYHNARYELEKLAGPGR